MLTFSEIEQIIQNYHELGETLVATQYLIDSFEMYHPNLQSIELTEKAKPDFILLTTEGIVGGPQIVKIPKNAFEFPLLLIINLLAHEMVHVRQKTKENLIDDKNEREWQAYYEMLFHKIFPLVPDASVYHRKFFAGKALEYYNRMGENSELQLKYADQKREVEQLKSELELL